MQVSRADLWWAVSRGVIGREQVEPLWQALAERGAGRQSFDLPHLAYYLGALIVISAMGWFMNQAWEVQGGSALLVIAVAYGVIFASVGWRLWTREGLRVPGGLLITTAVCMVPLAVYALERLTGIWPQGDPGPYRGYHVWVKGSWFLMEAATIVAGLVALTVVRFPFLTAPIAFSLWYMSMDLTPLLFGRADFTWEERLWVSLLFGLVMLVVTYLVDRRTEEDFAFWGYLFGLAAFWGGPVAHEERERGEPGALLRHQCRADAALCPPRAPGLPRLRGARGIRLRRPPRLPRLSGLLAVPLRPHYHRGRCDLPRHPVSAAPAGDRAGDPGGLPGGRPASPAAEPRVRRAA
ncbi:MAG TPA: hypothetical protein VHO73_00950 [Methylomirabilota bacterium]|nr:hypothetical protein [Methylomirabilota bacterium]